MTNLFNSALILFSASEKYFIVLTILICLTMAMMIVMCIRSTALNIKTKVKFIFAFSIIALISILDITTIVISYKKLSNLLWLEYIMLYLIFASSTFLPLLVMDFKQNRTFKIVVHSVYLAYIIVLAFLVGFNQVFYFDSEVVYHRVNVGFWFYTISFYISVLLLFVDVAFKTKSMIARFPFLLIVLTLVFIAGSCIQFFAADIHVSYLIISLVVVIYYIYNEALKSQLDGLTGLYSRFMYQLRIKSLKEGETVFIMDIDSFKKINDELGHLEGDHILKEVAKILQSVFGKVGAVYRIGGDEFAAIVHKGTNNDELKATLKNRLKEHEIHLPEVSCGYAVFEKGQLPKDIGDFADKRMYTDKRNKKTYL